MAKVATGHGADDVRVDRAGAPLGTWAVPEELWDEEELWVPGWRRRMEGTGRTGRRGRGRGRKSGGPVAVASRDARDGVRPTTSAEVLELDASWRAAEDALARTAPIASVHAALWRPEEQGGRRPDAGRGVCGGRRLFGGDREARGRGRGGGAGTRRRRAGWGDGAPTLGRSTSVYRRLTNSPSVSSDSTPTRFARTRRPSLFGSWSVASLLSASPVERFSCTPCT